MEVETCRRKGFFGRVGDFVSLAAYDLAERVYWEEIAQPSQPRRPSGVVVKSFPLLDCSLVELESLALTENLLVPNALLAGGISASPTPSVLAVRRETLRLVEALLALWTWA